MPASSPASVCQIAPQHLAIVRTVTAATRVGLVASLLTGRTCFRRLIDRDDEPVQYSSTVACIRLPAVSSLVGLVFRPSD
jgi:hypothetical protein